MDKKVDILAIGAHPDDVELSAGGTIAKATSDGKKVAILDLTEGELGSRGDVATRYREAEAAAKVLNVSYRENLKLPDGFLTEDRETLMKIIAKIRQYRPEICLINAPSDRHPDHGIASKIVARACFLSGLLKIETELNGDNQEKWRPRAVYHYIQDNHLEPDFVVDITGFEEQKFEAIKAYESQFFKEGMKGPKTPISGKDFFDLLHAKLVMYGRPIQKTAAEGFISNRTVGVNQITDLI